VAAALAAEPGNFDGSAARRLNEARSVQAMQAAWPPQSDEHFGSPDAASGSFFRALSADFPAPVVVWDNALSGSSSDSRSSEGDGGSSTATASDDGGGLLALLARSAELVFVTLSAAAPAPGSGEPPSQATQSSVWYAAGAVPTCGVEALLPALRQLVPGLRWRGGGGGEGSSDDDEWVGCEYWVRVQPAGRGVAAHYDFDVTRKRLPAHAPRHGLFSPHRSSVFYLSGAAAADGASGRAIGSGSRATLSSASGGSGAGQAVRNAQRELFGAGPTVVLEQRRAPGAGASADGEVMQFLISLSFPCAAI
jgi:hypothetical protein